MPRLRRLNGLEVIRILGQFGFEVKRIRGIHHRLHRVIEGREQVITVAVRGSQPIPLPTLRSIYREACKYIPEIDLETYFYT